MRITSKADYAVRAMIELATADGLLTAEGIAARQGMPTRFLLNILNELRVARLVESRRGRDGGYRLACPAAEVSVADVLRAVEGPLADVAGKAPEDLDYPGATAPLRDVWIATRGAVRQILETVTLDDLAAGELPEPVLKVLGDPGVQHRR
ncbi:RrF2 family transcriptional regulator [Tomitella fengzijianii]|uniref:Rrf2 family transcriptional regulator n=1 Tax=Tomitella fengzijianii TaxID=2597660 RepID=A0A516X5A8_9ACTN|nr:Rrf2 family transcriptional regulator [Tomitella fengzijianii]QDQ98230.1 Rrf2 family transcriptional regulator [Tomitella fengzijianii]